MSFFGACMAIGADPAHLFFSAAGSLRVYLWFTRGGLSSYHDPFVKTGSSVQSRPSAPGSQHESETKGSIGALEMESAGPEPRLSASCAPRVTSKKNNTRPAPLDRHRPGSAPDVDRTGGNY